MGLTIEEMVIMAKRLSEERGRFISYGDLQREQTLASMKNGMRDGDNFKVIGRIKHECEDKGI